MLEKLNEITKILDEAYDHYFEHSDGHCKSSEGHISMDFNTFFDRRAGQRMEPSIEIYSYVFAPEGRRWNGTLDEALAEVTRWRDEELAQQYLNGDPADPCLKCGELTSWDAVCQKCARENPCTATNRYGDKCSLYTGHDRGHLTEDDLTMWWD